MIETLPETAVLSHALQPQQNTNPTLYHTSRNPYSKSPNHSSSSNIGGHDKDVSPHDEDEDCPEPRECTPLRKRKVLGVIGVSVTLFLEKMTRTHCGGTALFVCFLSPDRWMSISEAAMETPGIWGNQMTFMGGSRGCIGFQFAVYE